MSDENGTQREQVEQYILDLLAAQEQRDATQLREELSAHGAEMPYDSVLLVELIAVVQRRYGVRLQADLATARDMRSVRSFAERIKEEVDASKETPPDSPSVATGD